MNLARKLQYALVLWALMLAQGVAANVRWTGNAQDISQRDTITVTGTWATGDTATVTINNKSVTVTIGAAVSTANVAEVLGRAINAADTTTNLHGTETRNVGGQTIPEFTETTATYSGAVLTLTSDPGVPVTYTRSEVTAGDGALGAVTSVVVATGKNWLSNAANYDTGTIPIDNDVLYIDQGAVSILYGLGHFRTGGIDLDVILSNTFTGSIGLPLTRAVGAGYTEYRTPRYFYYRGGSKKFHAVQGGAALSSSVGVAYIDLQDQTLGEINIAANRTFYIAGAPAAAAAATVLSVTRGTIYIEPDNAATDPTKTFRPGTSIIGAPSGVPTDVVMHIGRNARMQFGSSYTQNSGTVVAESPFKVGADESEIRLHGGSLELRMSGSGTDNGNVYVYGGTLYPVGVSAMGAVRIYTGASADFRRGAGGFLPDSVHMTAGSSMFDPTGGSVAEVNLIGATVIEVTLDLPSNRTLTYGGTAIP